MNRNALAILTNQIGDYDETADLLKIDVELLERTITGEPLTRFEVAEVESAFNQLYLSDLALEHGIDITELAALTDNLDETASLFHDQDYENEFRQAVARGVVDTQYLDIGGTLFGNLTASQSGQILELFADDSKAGRQRVSEMFDAYLLDYENDDDFWDIEESEFWEWFRETFYGDD